MNIFNLSKEERNLLAEIFTSLAELLRMESTDSSGMTVFELGQTVLAIGDAIQCTADDAEIDRSKLNALLDDIHIDL